MTNLANDLYGRTVSLSSDGITDTYTVTDSASNAMTLAFPTGTVLSDVYAAINSMAPGVPSIQVAIKQQLINFSNSVESYVENAFSLRTQIRFFFIYYSAQQNGLTNRAAYIQPFLTWLEGLLTYAAVFEASLMRMSDPNAVMSTTWDLTNGGALIVPNITLAGAMMISN